MDIHRAGDAGRLRGENMAARTPRDRRDAGAALRREVPREAHAAWHPSPARRDPVAILVEQDAGRIPELLPVRYGRMRKDPFAFLRGAAAVMAADLAATPTPGLFVQSCGDCHLANFGAFASPEGTPVFDVNDFDETLPAPFEWDVKRLAASLAVAGRVAGLGDAACRALARTAARGYRRHITELAWQPPLDAWTRGVDLAAAVAAVEPPKLRDRLRRRLRTVLASGADHFGLLEAHGGHGGWRIKEKPPLVFRLDEHALPARAAFAAYAETLPEERRVLLRRYDLQDVAFKVVGVGSIGTFCAVGLLVSGGGAPLLLQLKQAQASVLAPYAGPSAYANQGERVVVGQRMLQAASDVFLGWTPEPVAGRQFYVRRLKDPGLANVGERLEAALPFYAGLCGLTLARAHARSGDAAAIAGYLGKSPAFENAIAQFAIAYADQTERDWRTFLAAVKAGRLPATGA
jgi:uncharacterized protein (DUF2252 family)